jgi:hypothetical protein
MKMEMLRRRKVKRKVKRSRKNLFKSEKHLDVCMCGKEILYLFLFKFAYIFKGVYYNDSKQFGKSSIKKCMPSIVLNP